MGLVKATFADGTEWVFDPEVNAHATHYNEHKLVSEVDVPDDTPLGFRAPATSLSVSGDFVPSAG